LKTGYFTVFLIIISIFTDVYADDNPLKKGQKCQEYESSYSNLVLKARQLVNRGYLENAASLFKKHLDCWNDPEVSTELAALYSSQKKYYLAGLVLKEAGLIDLYNETEKLRISQNSEERISQVKFSAAQKASGFERSYRKNKDTAIPLIILGTAAFGTGLGLFLHEKAFSGTNSKTAQYALMFSGFSLIGTGIRFNLAAEIDKNFQNSYSDVSNYSFDLNSILDDDYINKKTDNTAKLNSVQAMKNHGSTLIILSIPMLALSGFAIYESIQYVLYGGSIFNFRDDGAALLYFIFRLFIVPEITAIITIFPSIYFLVQGIKSHVNASKWSKLTEDNYITLNYITPVIDPASKTYGLSMGFSF